MRGNGRSLAKKGPNPTDRHVGARIRMRRLMLGMSQTNLAEGLRLTFQQVQKYEKGTNRVGAGRLQQTANILQVPIGFFFEDVPDVPYQKPGAKDAFSSAYVTDFLASRDGVALVASFMKISSVKLRRSIVDLVRVMAQDMEK
jgi:transcriptional regulator with XRE-family HTH domain